MSVKVKFRTNFEAMFEFHGENPELFLKSILRVCENPKYRHDPRSRTNASAVVEVCSGCYSNNFWLNSLGLRLLKARIKSAQLYMEIEKALEQIKEGKWSEIEYCFGYGNFRIGIRRIWSLIVQEGLLEFERKVFNIVAQNGGVSVEAIITQLLNEGVVTTFKKVRDALGHLEILYMVEKQHNQYSIRWGILEDA
jgi:hypothetical protein